MEEAPVTAATGALGPVIAKLAALLGTEYKLRWCSRRDIKFIRSKLKPVHSILWNTWEREELDAPSMALKMEALDLADDVDDAIVNFILCLEHNLSNKRLVQTKIKASPFQNFKKRASAVLGRCRSKWNKPSSSLLSCGKIATGDCCPAKPRAYPFIRKDVSELEGMVKPRDELIQHLVGEDETAPVELQVKTASIVGMAGMGKTTLADLVYEKIGDKFESRAFVSVTPGGNMREILAKILEQVAPNSSVPVAGTKAATEEEQLINVISNFLNDKRYLIIIDDIWNMREWEVIMRSLPENNLGSRIVRTTRITPVPKKWASNHDPNVLVYQMHPIWDCKRGSYYEGIIVNLMKSMKALVAEGLDCEHPIVQLCGGVPLAVRCMLTAVAEEREKHAQKGLYPQACDVQDEVFKHVVENGIQNTPGFEALVESLQLGFDVLPHHMIKTCLLYCCIYPEGHIFEIHDLVRKWISEGFVHKEDEANSYFHELVNRGFIMNFRGSLRMHPMMRNFLQWKSRQDNFITWSSEITPSNNNSCIIRRLCICNSPYGYKDAAVYPLLSLDWYHIRSLVVYEGIEQVPFEKLEGVCVLDLCGATNVMGHHWKDICGLVHLRHLLGLSGDGNSEIPPEIVRLQCLETFQVRRGGFTRLPGFIGNLQQLKTLDVRGEWINELPKEFGVLQNLRTLIIQKTDIHELPREIGSLQQLETLDISSSWTRELPKEIGNLQQLKTLDISGTPITELPKEIGSMHQLKTLDLTRTQITELPKEIGKLQHLEHLLMKGSKVAKIPREIGRLKKLRSFKMNKFTAALPLEVCQASTIVKHPEFVRQVLKKSDLLSELDVEMLSIQMNGGLVVGAKQMHIPPWIREHFNELYVLDIRICKLDEQGLKILQEMPKMWQLTLRFEVVPREPVVISSQGFPRLNTLIVDSRVPRVTFQQGAMPVLNKLVFLFQFYSSPPNKDPVGINHLTNLNQIEFICNQDWYQVGGIGTIIDVVWEEAQKIRKRVAFNVCGRWETIVEEVDRRGRRGLH